MLSDSLFEIVEKLWEEIRHYEYSDSYKNELINAITEMAFITYQLDRMKKDIIWTKEDMRKYVTDRWDSGLDAEEWFEKPYKRI